MVRNIRNIQRIRAAVFGLGLLAAAPLSAQTTFPLKDMPGTRGLVAEGRGGLLPTNPISPMQGELGRASALVDLNGDGFDDLIVGAPGLPTVPGSGILDDAGHVYVLFGSAEHGLPGHDSDFTFANFAQGEAIDFVGAPGQRVGYSIAAAGDVNGDGFQDVIIGAPGHGTPDRPGSGGAYILFGRPDFSALPKAMLLAPYAAGPDNRAVFVRGARAFGGTGLSVSGRVDSNSDGRHDVVLGSPFDSTGGRTQNGTATVLYGQVGFPFLAEVDLLTQVAGQVTVVHGNTDFQLLGFSVAGLGKFDAVLPMSGTSAHPTLGDDIAIGAPGTTVGTGFFAGAAYVLRGVAAGIPAAAYSADQFGNGPDRAGIVYLGQSAGDQAGYHVASAGDLLFDGQGFVDLIITAPFSDAFGRPDAGSIYIVAGNFLGVNPQGFDLGLLGQGSPSILGVHIQGAQTANGQHGVFAANAGDWNGDNWPDLLVGFPNATWVSGPNVYVGAGRARVLDGAKVLLAQGTVDLADTTKGWDLLTLHGETSGARIGSGLASGDFNGDGSRDISVGGWGAPSTPDPFDPTGIGNSRTGRAHIVYGPVIRADSISPSLSHFGGPVVTVSASNVPATPVAVLVDGVLATKIGQVAGTPGSVTFQPPPPLVPGNLADVQLVSSAGKLTLLNVLQYQALAVTSGPVPNSGFAGAAVEFTGQAFSKPGDFSVTIGGFPAQITAVDGLTGTATAILPAGPPDGMALDVLVSSANGSQLLPGAMSYLPLVVAAVSPDSGQQTSGIFVVNPSLPYQGEPAAEIQITALLAGRNLPPDPLVTFGNDTVGFRPAAVKSVVGDVITVFLPAFLLGDETDVDVRVTAGGETGSLTGGFTYLASDFRELGNYSQIGFGTEPHKAMMAGEFAPGGDVLLLMGVWPPQMQLAVMSFGFGLENPPATLKGGPFGINLAQPFYVFFFPFPGLPAASVYQKMPAFIDPAADGVPLYLQVVTREASGPVTQWGFSNVLEMTVRASP